MNLIITIILALLLTPAAADARMNVGVLGGGVSAAACSASYGSEIRTGNTCEEPSDTDGDATTGWASLTLAQMISVDTSDSTCGDGDDDCPDPQRGTYQLFGRADSDADRMAHDLSGYSLTASTVYKLSYYARHAAVAGTATWACVISASNAGPSSVGTYRQSITTAENTYANYYVYFLYNATQDFFNCGEAGASNDGGIYLDNFSLTTATLCYGSELATGHAASLTGEADATTGWTSLNSGTVASVDNSDTVCDVTADQDCAAPHNGSFSLFINSDQSTASSGAYFDLNTILTAGTKYMFRAWVRNDGTNAWGLGIGSTTSNFSSHNTYLASATYSEIGFSFTHNATSTRYLTAAEANAGNDGYLYIDGLSIMEITGE